MLQGPAFSGLNLAKLSTMQPVPGLRKSSAEAKHPCQGTDEHSVENHSIPREDAIDSFKRKGDSQTQSINHPDTPKLAGSVLPRDSGIGIKDEPPSSIPPDGRSLEINAREEENAVIDGPGEAEMPHNVESDDVVAAGCLSMVGKFICKAGQKAARLFRLLKPCQNVVPVSGG